VNKPGNYELELGKFSLRQLVNDFGGGVPGDKKVKAILMSGASSNVLMGTDDVLDAPMDYESIAAKGAALGSASVIVVDESVDMAWLTLKTTRFFKHESCGKCTPCREGTYWMLNILERVNKGEVMRADVDLLNTVANQIAGKCLCPLGEFAVAPVLTSLKQFRADFDAHAKDKPKATAPAAKPAAGAARPAPAARPTPAAKPAPAKTAEPAAGD
jgi:NADH-quinone oxidoreductase subunit F